MKKFTVTTKTSAQIDTVIDEICDDLTPDESPQLRAQIERLAPYRHAILKQRRRGFSWKQLVGVMADPRINENVSAKVLKKVFGANEKSAKKSTKPRVQKPKTKPQTPTPKASSAPEQPSHLPPEYRPYFDRAIVNIVTTNAVDDVAIIQLGEATGGALGEDMEKLNKYVYACLDEIDQLERDATLKKYHLKAASWDDWRPQWCKFRNLPAEQ
jgi:hypothetical protein